MNDIVLKRLYDAGWTSDRKVDITPIEEAYAFENMVIPDRLREFFISYGFLVIKYDIQHTEPERHSINPIADFKNYSKEDFAHLLDDYEIYGMNMMRQILSSRFLHHIGLIFRDSLRHLSTGVLRGVILMIHMQF